MSQLRQRSRANAVGGVMRQAEGLWSVQPRSLEPSSPGDGDPSPPRPCYRPNPASPTQLDGIYYEMDSYCHELSLPLRISPAPSEPYILRLCIHPNYIPVPDATIHLVRDSAIVSHTSFPHEPTLVQVNYELVDLWANAQQSRPSSSRSSSESPEAEAAPEGRLSNLAPWIPNRH